MRERGLVYVHEFLKGLPMSRVFRQHRGVWVPLGVPDGMKFPFPCISERTRAVGEGPGKVGGMKMSFCFALLRDFDKRLPRRAGCGWAL